MYCVNKTTQTEDTIKKSRFIGILIPCPTESEALQHLTQLQQQYPDASHLVFAYRIKTLKGIVTRFHDAGEPRGTAGKPIFQHLAGKNLINLICVVVRYFGGIKLGAGGLTRAYSNTAKKVIEASTLCKYIEYTDRSFTIDYKQMQNFEYQLKIFDGLIVNQDFSEKVTLTIKIPESKATDFSKIFQTLKTTATEIR
ncbi:MAG: YigZ family protein [Methylococcales bacterium]